MDDKFESDLSTLGLKHLADTLTASADRGDEIDDVLELDLNSPELETLVEALKVSTARANESLTRAEKCVQETLAFYRARAESRATRNR